MKVDQSVANSVRQDDLTDAKFHYVDARTGQEKNISLNTSKLFSDNGEGFNIPANTDVSKKAYFEFKAANNTANDVQTETLQLKIISTSDNLTVTTATAKGYIEEGNARPTAVDVEHELTIGDSVYIADERGDTYIVYKDKDGNLTPKELFNINDFYLQSSGKDLNELGGASDIVVDNHTGKMYITRTENTRADPEESPWILTGGSVTHFYELDPVTKTGKLVGTLGGIKDATLNKNIISGFTVINNEVYVLSIAQSEFGLTVGKPTPVIEKIAFRDNPKYPDHPIAEVVKDSEVALGAIPSGDMTSIGDDIYVTVNRQLPEFKNNTANNPDYLIKYNTKTGQLQDLGDLWTIGDDGQKHALDRAWGLSAVNGKLYVSNIKWGTGKDSNGHKTGNDNIIYEINIATGEATPVMRNFLDGDHVRTNANGIGGTCDPNAPSGWGGCVDWGNTTDQNEVYNEITGMGSGLEGRFDVWFFSLANKVSDPENNNTVKIKFKELSNKGTLYVEVGADSHAKGVHYDEVNTSTKYAKDSKFKFVANGNERNPENDMHLGDNTTLKYVAIDEQGQESVPATIKIYDKVIERPVVETSIAHIDANNVTSRNQGFTVTASRTKNGREQYPNITHSGNGIGVEGNPWGAKLGRWQNSEIEKLTIEFTQKKAQNVDIVFNDKGATGQGLGAEPETVRVDFYDGNTKVGSMTHTGKVNKVTDDIAIRFAPESGVEFNKIVITPEGNKTGFYIKDITANRLTEDNSVRSIEYDENDIFSFMNDVVIDGGAGRDVVTFYNVSGKLNIDSTKISNIELLDLDDEHIQSINLTAQDVINMTDENNTLFINADENDSVTLQGFEKVNLAKDTGIYTAYQSGEAMVFIDLQEEHIIL